MRKSLARSSAFAAVPPLSHIDSGSAFSKPAILAATKHLSTSTLFGTTAKNVGLRIQHLQ